MSSEWDWLGGMLHALAEAGHSRLVDLVSDLSGWVVNNQHDQVDAAVPEALALTRPLRLPWLEVYVRKWHLESRIWKRFQGKSVLPEAIDLAALAHRLPDRNKILTLGSIYELVGCYSVVDGPGYASERKRVIDEVMPQLSLLEDHGTFDCFLGHYASALMDLGLHQQAFDFLTQQRKVLAKHHIPLWESSNIAQYSIRCLALLGRYEEALREAEVFQPRVEHDQSRWMRIQIYKSGILAAMGRLDEALKTLPDISSIRPNPGYYKLWSEPVRILVQAGVLPYDVHLAATLQEFAVQLQQNGAIRPAVDVAQVAAELALHRESAFFAQKALALGQQVLLDLVNPRAVSDAWHVLQDRFMQQQALEQASPSEHTPRQDALPEVFPDDPLQVWNLVEPHLNRHPHREDLVVAGAHALWKLGYPLLSAELIHTFALKHGWTEELAIRWGLLLVNLPALRDALLAQCPSWIENSDPSLRSAGMFLRGYCFHLQKKWEDSNADLYALLALQPSAENTRLLLCQNEAALHHFDKALDLANQAIALGMDPGAIDWHRMEVATVSQDWQAVRDSARRLGIALSSENGPVNEKWGALRIRFTQEEEVSVYVAVRTGPVTARILEIALPGRTQHVGEHWVFSVPQGDQDPAPDTDEDHVPVYNALYLLDAPAQVVFDLDGVHPGQDRVQRLTHMIETLGGQLQVRSNEAYTLALGDEGHLGIYAMVSVPAASPWRLIPSQIEMIMQGGPHPLVYVQLAQLLEDPSVLAEQQRRKDHYEL